MSIENLNEYILQYQRYKEGNYEYSTIKKKNDVKNAINGGKKIVFVTGKHKTIVMLIVGGISLIIGLIVGGLSSKYDDLVSSMIFGLFGTIFLVFLALGLWKLRTSFIVLGLEGFVYKSRIGGIKGYKWKDVKMDQSATESDQIYILMPEGDIFNISFFDYRSKEFSLDKHFYYKYLAIFTFKIYYNYGKKRTFELQRISIEEDQQQISQEFTKSLSASMDIDNYPELLKEEFRNYKIKRYKFSIYGTGEQIQKEFLKGKIFVLKGGLGVGMWILTILLFVIALVSLFISLLPDPDTIYFIIFPIITFPIGLISLLTLRMCLVIAPLGVYYRKILNSGAFSWNNVNDIQWKYQKAKISRMSGGVSVGVEVKIYMSNGRKIRFRSTNYLKKEFRKKVKKEMFLKLFNIYFELGQNLETSRRAFKGLEAKEVTQKKLKSEKKMAPNAKEKE